MRALQSELRTAALKPHVFIGSGAKLIGDTTIADDVAIAANCVVVNDIEEAGTTWGGVPARKISEKILTKISEL